MAAKWKALYEDGHIIVCDKPAGVPVQSRRIDRPDLEGMVRSYLMRQSGRRDTFVAAVHRLDQPVEGMVLMAKTKKAAGILSSKMQEGMWLKEYLAVTQGHMPQQDGVLENYIVKDARTQTAHIVPTECENAKYAKLEYSVLESVEEIQLVKIRLFTGRFHQIRVQFAHAGCPLVGDSRYNPDGKRMGKNPALCACTLVFEHPVTGEELTFTRTPVGEIFQKFTYIREMCTH